MTTERLESDLAMNWKYSASLLIFAATMLTPCLVFGSKDGSDVGNYICYVAGTFRGTVGAGIATIGISTIGMLALVGRVTWTQALVVGVGVSVLFSAPHIVTSLGGYMCP